MKLRKSTKGRCRFLLQLACAWYSAGAQDSQKSRGGCQQQYACCALSARLDRRKLKQAPRQFTLGGRRRIGNSRNANLCTLTADGGASYIIDALTGQRRNATQQDWLDATRVIDSIDDVGVYWAMVDPGFAHESSGILSATFDK